MSEYKVTDINVDGGPPREWKGPKGTVYYIAVSLEGHEKPVSIGKKTPDALKPGDTVYGEIEETDYLTDKWKHGEAPQGSGSSSSQENKYQRDVTALSLDVYRVVANIRGLPENAEDSARFWDIVMSHTNELLSMIDKVRSSDRVTSGSLPVLPTQSGAIKETTLPLEKSATEPKSLGATFREKRAVTANDEPEYDESDMP